MGSADKEKFNVLPPKSEQVAIEVHHDDREKHLFELYDKVYELRRAGREPLPEVREIFDDLARNYPREWLLRLEICELLTEHAGNSDLETQIVSDLQDLQKESEDYNSLIASGLDLLKTLT